MFSAETRFGSLSAKEGILIGCHKLKSKDNDNPPLIVNEVPSKNLLQQLNCCSSSIFHSIIETASIDTISQEELQNIKNCSFSSVSTLYQNLCELVKKFQQNFSKDLVLCNNIESLSSLWRQTKEKLRLIDITFSPISPRSFGHLSLSSVFYQSLKDNTCVDQSFFKLITTSYLQFSQQYNQFVDIPSLLAFKNDRSTYSDFLSQFSNSFDLLSIFNFYDSFLDNFFLQLLSDFSQHFIPFSNETPFSYFERTQTLINNHFEILSHVLPLSDVNDFISLANKNVYKMICNCVIENPSPKTSSLTGISKLIGEMILVSNYEMIKKLVKLSWSCDSISSLTKSVCTAIEKILEKLLEEENPISKICSLYKSLDCISNFFLPQTRENITSSFLIGLNYNPNLIASLLAMEFHHFLLRQQNPSQSQLFFIFKSLKSKTIFQSYHSTFMAKRALICNPTIFALDKQLTQNFEMLCGKDYVEPFKSIIRDITQSQNLYTQFEKSNPIQVSIFSKNHHYFDDRFQITNKIIDLNILEMSSISWPSLTKFELNKTKNLKLPKRISKVYSLFSAFYHDTLKKRTLKWSHNLSSATLYSTNYHSYINCPVIIATILLCFDKNNSILPKTAKGISSYLSISEEECENALSLLASKKIKVLIRLSDDRFYAINPKMKDDIHVPTNISKNLKIAIENNNSIFLDKSTIIDAAIMRITKEKRNITSYELKSLIQNEITFPFDDQFFQNRLENLSKRVFIKLDALGRIEYIP